MQIRTCLRIRRSRRVSHLAALSDEAKTMTIKSIGLIAALAFVGAACGTKEAPGPLEPGGPTGRVRFVNLVTDPARVPVNAILEAVPFGVNLGYGATAPATLPS